MLLVAMRTKITNQKTNIVVEDRIFENRIKNRKRSRETAKAMKCSL